MIYQRLLQQVHDGEQRSAMMEHQQQQQQHSTTAGGQLSEQTNDAKPSRCNDNSRHCSTSSGPATASTSATTTHTPFMISDILHRSSSSRSTRVTSTNGVASDLDSFYGEESLGRVSPLASDDADGKDRDREDGSIGSDSDQERQSKYTYALYIF